MLALFKGELTLNEIMWGLHKKRIIELRDTRRKQLIAEQKELDRITNERNSASIREQILSK